LAIIFTGFGIVLPVFPKFLQQNDAGESISLGVLLASYAVTQIIFAPLYGRLSDKGFGRRPFILLALFGYGIGNFLYAFIARDFLSMIVIRVFEGVMVAGLFPMSQALVTDLTESENRAKYLGILTGSANVGIVIGPALGGFLFEIGGFALPFILSGILAFISLVFAFFMVPETKKKYGKPIIFSQDELANVSSDSFISRIRNTIKSWFIPGGVILFIGLLFISFLDFISWIMIEPGIIFYLYDIIGFSPFDFGIFVGLYGVTVVIGQVFFGGLSDRFGRNLIIFIGGIAHFLGYLVLIFASSFLEFMLMPIFAGVAIALIHPALTALVGDLAIEKHRGQVIGILAIPVQFAGIIGPLFGGWFSEAYSVTPLFWLSALFGISICFVVLLQTLNPLNKGKAESKIAG
jgi:DHA1 family tetracycline resistance protein-like MFS transporter